MFKFNEKKFFSGLVVDEYFKITEAIPHYNFIHEQVVNMVCKTMDMNAHIVIADLGCGPGWLLSKLRAKLPCSELIGVDLSDAFHQSYLKRNVKNDICFEFSDILEWLNNQPASSLDTVLSSWVFHNWPKDYRRLVFMAISRVLKPNGIFINADKIASLNELENNKALQEQVKIFIDVFAIENKDLLSSWVLHYIEDECPEVRFTTLENHELHHEYGFTAPVISCRRLMDCISFAYKKK